MSEAKQTREQEKIKARRPRRVTYDLPPQVRAALRDLAEHERLPASQLVTLAVLRYLREYHQGRGDLALYKHPSRSPRYEWNLAFPEDLFAWAHKRSRDE